MMRKISRYIHRRCLSLSLVMLAVTCGHSVARIQNPVWVDKVQERLSAPTQRTTGTVISPNAMMLTVGVEGEIAWFEEAGALIKAGDPIVKLDLAPLKLNKQRLIAQRTRQQAKQAFLQRELSRLTDLAKTSYAAEKERDEIEMQLHMANAAIDELEARIALVKDKMARSVILAPGDGVVTERLRKAGEYVKQGQELGQFLDMSAREIRAYIPVKFAQLLDQHTQIAISAANKTVEASIKALIPNSRSRTQTIELRLHMPELLAHSVFSGQFVDVWYPSGELENAIYINRDALLLTPDGVWIAKVTDENKIKKIRVFPGKGSGQYITILNSKQSGLQDGDTVIVRGAETVKDGQEVNIVKSMASNQ